MIRQTLVAAATAALFLAGCGTQPAPEPPTDAPVPQPSSLPTGAGPTGEGPTGGGTATADEPTPVPGGGWAYGTYSDGTPVAAVADTTGGAVLEIAYSDVWGDGAALRAEGLTLEELTELCPLGCDGTIAYDGGAPEELSITVPEAPDRPSLALQDLREVIWPKLREASKVTIAVDDTDVSWTFDVAGIDPSKVPGLDA